MQNRSSLFGRILLALLLSVGFYLLALAILAGLVYILYFEFFIWRRIQLQLTAFAIVGILTLVWALFPRFDRFVPPGPRLKRKEHPRLFAEIERIANQVKQPMPREVYLVPDVNAFVTERGGWMGMGSRRVMGVGLPLLQSLTLSQFRAVLAHEFGHFYGGDTKLAPLVYKTRAAIGRTLGGLDDGSILQIPFHWYGEMFLRVTQAVSRRQEYVADELAARTIGRQPLVDGLRRVNGIAPAFQGYWDQEVMPVLKAGFRPALVDGFSQFIATRAIADQIDQIVQTQLQKEETTPYDTHPSLRERIAALDVLPPGSQVEDATPAMTLLNHAPQMERALLEHLFGKNVLAFDLVQWQDVGRVVYLPQYQRIAQVVEPVLKGVKASALPEQLHIPSALSRQLQQQSEVSLTLEQKQGLMAHFTAMALTAALVREGWEIDARPGMPVSVMHGETSIVPANVMRDVIQGKISAEEWQQRCAEWGIVEIEMIHE